MITATSVKFKVSIVLFWLWTAMHSLHFMIVVAMLVAFAFNAIESNATSESVQCNRECTAEKLECSDECRLGEDAIDRSEVI